MKIRVCKRHFLALDTIIRGSLCSGNSLPGPLNRAKRGIFEVNTNLEGKITAPSTVYVGYASYFDALIALIRSLPMLLARNKYKTKLFNTIIIILVLTQKPQLLCRISSEKD